MTFIDPNPCCATDTVNREVPPGTEVWNSAVSRRDIQLTAHDSPTITVRLVTAFPSGVPRRPPTETSR